MGGGSEGAGAWTTGAGYRGVDGGGGEGGGAGRTCVRRIVDKTDRRQ